MKELWCFNGNRISVRFEYEWRDIYNPNQWMRTHGNEHQEFNDDGLMLIRDISANDYPIKESERHYRQWLINRIIAGIIKSKKLSLIHCQKHWIRKST